MLESRGVIRTAIRIVMEAQRDTFGLTLWEHGEFQKAMLR